MSKTMERKIRNKSKKSKKIMRRNTLRRNTLRRKRSNINRSNINRSNRKRSNIKRSKRRTIKGGSAALYSSVMSSLTSKKCPAIAVNYSDTVQDDTHPNGVRTEGNLALKRLENEGMPYVIQVIALPEPGQPTMYELHFPKASLEKLVKALCAYIKSFINLQQRYTNMGYTITYTENFAEDIDGLRRELAELVKDIPWDDATATGTATKTDDAKVNAAKYAYDAANEAYDAANDAYDAVKDAYDTAAYAAIDADDPAAAAAAAAAKDAAAAAAAAKDAAAAAKAVYIWSQGAPLVAKTIDEVLDPENILSNTVTDMFPDITIIKRFNECTQLLKMINNIINYQHELMHSLVRKFFELKNKDVSWWPRLIDVPLTTRFVDCDKRVSEINKLLQWFTVPDFSESYLVPEVYVSEPWFPANGAYHDQKRYEYPLASKYVDTFKGIFKWIIDGFKT